MCIFMQKIIIIHYQINQYLVLVPKLQVVKYVNAKTKKSIIKQYLLNQTGDCKT